MHRSVGSQWHGAPAKRTCGLLTILALTSLWLCTCGALGQSPEQAAIHVEASKVHNRITPWMIGSCIEDVNHEIYGGLYAQQIFGESFEEPPQAHSPLAGWKAYGGVWQVADGALHVK